MLHAPRLLSVSVGINRARAEPPGALDTVVCVSRGTMLTDRERPLVAN